VRYEAAKLIEEEQETEIEEAEQQRRKVVPDITVPPSDPHQTNSSPRTGCKLSGGGWHESESGMFWEPGDTSGVLDSSSDGLAAMHAARQQAAALAGTAVAASQDDDENYTKGTQQSYATICRKTKIGLNIPRGRLTTPLKNLEVLGILTAVIEKSWHWPRIRKLSGQNFVRRNF